MFLTSDELCELTGYKRPSAQIRWLRENGFTLRVAADGHPRVERSHFEAIMGAQGARKRRSEPDFQALRKAG